MRMSVFGPPSSYPQITQPIITAHPQNQLILHPSPAPCSAYIPDGWPHVKAEGWKGGRGKEDVSIGWEEGRKRRPRTQHYSLHDLSGEEEIHWDHQSIPRNELHEWSTSLSPPAPAVCHHALVGLRHEASLSSVLHGMLQHQSPRHL